MSRISMAEAARELDVHRSTVTRWCKSHPALKDTAGLVDPDELRRHRDATINPALQTRKRAASETDPGDLAKVGGVARRRVTGPKGAGDEAVDRVQPESPAGDLSGLNTHRSRTEAAKAQSAELDLAIRLKQTLSRAEVEAAAADAGEILRQMAFQLARDKAEVLARIDDPRHMERAIEDMMRELLTAGAQALKAIATEDRPADAA